MKNLQRWFAGKTVISSMAALALAALGATESLAAPTFYSTSDASKWQVATNVLGGAGDGQFSSFPTTGFTTATAIYFRPGWIANNDTGNNGPMEDWTFFTFKQTFDLTGYDAATADLQFQWAADDSGQGFASRGTWVPKFSLNGGSLVSGSWPPFGTSYSYGPTVDLHSGFHAGLNTLTFYVEGNGVTDGFSLQTIGFTARALAPVPEPETFGMMLAGLGMLGVIGRRKRKAAA